MQVKLGTCSKQVNLGLAAVNNTNFIICISRNIYLNWNALVGDSLNQHSIRILTDLARRHFSRYRSKLEVIVSSLT